MGMSLREATESSRPTDSSADWTDQDPDPAYLMIAAGNLSGVTVEFSIAYRVRRFMQSPSFGSFEGSRTHG